MLVQAYGMTQNHFTVTRHALVGGSATLHIMDIYPMQWPLAKIKIPIDYLIQRVERLLTGFANEISATLFFFCCIAERAIKPCRSSRSKLRGEFGIPRHLQNRNQKHNKAKTGNRNTPKQQNQTTTQNKQKTKAGKCWNVKREVRRG